MRCTLRRRSGSIPLPRRQAPCTFPLDVDRRSGFSGTPWSSLPTVPVAPTLDALVLQRGCGEVGACSAQPLPPHARVRLLEQAVGIRRDLARLDQARHRTAMEVMRWFANPVRSATLALAQAASIARLLPRCGVSTASPGRKTNTGRAEAGSRASGCGADPETGHRGDTGG